MFNTIHQINKQSKKNVSNNMIIAKSHEKSFFHKFDIDSPLAKTIFNGGTNCIPTDNGLKKVVILQLMVCNQTQIIAELLYKNDSNED